jgi:hypothetical protein
MSQPVVSSRFGRHVALGLVAGVVLLLAILSTGSITAASASTENFCTGYNAAPYGQSGDRCSAGGSLQNLGGASVYSKEHSGCVDALNSSGNLVASWSCTAGAEHSAEAYFGFSQPLRGIVRNNTTGASTHLNGTQVW